MSKAMEDRAYMSDMIRAGAAMQRAHTGAQDAQTEVICLNSIHSKVESPSRIV